MPLLASITLPCAPVQVVGWDQLHAATVLLIKPNILELVQLLQAHDMWEESDDIERLRRRWVELNT